MSYDDAELRNLFRPAPASPTQADREHAAWLTLFDSHRPQGEIRAGHPCFVCHELWPCRVFWVCAALGRERGWTT